MAIGSTGAAETRFTHKRRACGTRLPSQLRVFAPLPPESPASIVPTHAEAGLSRGGPWCRITTGIAAEAFSEVYADEDRGAMRATAHSGLPFLVAAVVSASRSGRRSAAPWRAGFLGVHLVHARQIARLLRSGGVRDPVVRAQLGLGSPNYALLVAQTGLLTSRRWAGSQQAGRWSDAIDRQLLRAYAVASLVGLLKNRRPVGAYALVGALLVVGLAARRSS